MLTLILLIFALASAFTTRSGDTQVVGTEHYVNIEDVWYEYNPDLPTTFTKAVDNA